MKRKALVASIYGVAVLIVFFLPLPDTMQRSFNKEDCLATQGHWDSGNGRCIKGIFLKNNKEIGENHE